MNNNIRRLYHKFRREGREHNMPAIYALRDAKSLDKWGFRWDHPKDEKDVDVILRSEQDHGGTTVVCDVMTDNEGWWREIDEQQGKFVTRPEPKQCVRVPDSIVHSIPWDWRGREGGTWFVFPDGWDEGCTFSWWNKRHGASRGVARDAERRALYRMMKTLAEFLAGDRFYVGVLARVLDDHGNEIARDAIWGVDFSNYERPDECYYLNEVAGDVVHLALSSAKELLERRRAEHWRRTKFQTLDNVGEACR